MTFWELGIASEDDIIAWADARIRDSEHPDMRLIDLSTLRPKHCDKLPWEEFPAAPLLLPFPVAFSAFALTLDLADDDALLAFPAYAAPVAEAARIADELRVASPRLEGPHIGPVVNRSQFARIEELIEAGIAEGARLVAGGPGLPEGMNRGFYVRPTVFADVRPGMRIEREEIFGPVLSILPFDTEEEAVAIANDTPYGLTNYVQSGDGARRNRLARQLRSGMVQMNGRPRGAGAPFGGVKASGRAREGGIWGIEEFVEVKSISGWSPD